jgi:hypothetical protein
MLIHCLITLVLVIAAFAAGFYSCTCVADKQAEAGEVVFKDAETGRWLGKPSALAGIARQMQGDNEAELTDHTAASHSTRANVYNLKLNKIEPLPYQPDAEDESERVGR